MEKYESIVYGLLTAVTICVVIYFVSSCAKDMNVQSRLQEEGNMELKKECVKQGGTIIISETSYYKWNCIQGRNVKPGE